MGRLQGHTPFDRALLLCEVDDAVAALTALIEPMLMVFLGGALGGILIAMYMPIFTMSEAMMS